MVGIGYKSSSGQTMIPKYSPVYGSWKKGNTKPLAYRGFNWLVKIEYFGVYVERNNPKVYSVTVDYYNRDYAVKCRDMAIENLTMDGFTIKSSAIKLVRV